MLLRTQREAAEVLRLSERTLERMRLTGLGPAYVKAGRRVLYRQADLEKWVASQVRASTSEARR
jgi:excisionase family DNA binding protein